jgi:S1-C subfamily serine protease
MAEAFEPMKSLTFRNKALITVSTVTALAAAVLALAVSSGAGTPALAQTNPTPTPAAPSSKSGVKGNRAITQTLITEVITGSPAATAGLAAGDVVVAIDGVAITAKDDLSKAVTAKKPGDGLSLELLNSDGSKRTVSVTLGDNPQSAGAAYLGVRYGSHGNKRGGPGAPGGRGARGLAGPVVIADVQANSPAATAGLLKDDVITQVNGADVSDFRALQRTLASAKVGDTVSLTITRGGASQTVDVTLGDNPNKAGTPYLGISVAPARPVPATPGVSS